MSTGTTTRRIALKTGLLTAGAVGLAVAGASSAQAATATFKVTCSKLNIRASASTGSAIVGYLYLGNQVACDTTTTSGFRKIVSGPYAGRWAYSSYLTLVSVAPAPAPSPIVSCGAQQLNWLQGYDWDATAYLLRAQGYTFVSPTNGWNAGIDSALRSFQSTHGLCVDGLLTYDTLVALLLHVNASTTSPAGYEASKAFQTLLSRKHGYVCAIDGSYGYQSQRNIKAFQRGHGIPVADYVNWLTWLHLFSFRNIGPLHSLSQGSTGPASGANCGPSASVMVMLQRGIVPAGWDGYDANRATAIQNFRYGAMGLANTTYRNSFGTEGFEIGPGLRRYGLSVVEETDLSAALLAARTGRGAIAGGDRSRLPWSGGIAPSSHWIALLGFVGDWYIVGDSAVAGELHLASELTLRNYNSVNPGYGVNPRLRPPWLNNIVLN